MAFRRSCALTNNSNNNNRAEEMPFLQSFRRSSFDVDRDEHLPAIDVSLVSPNDDNFCSNHEAFSTKDVSADANANLGPLAGHGEPQNAPKKPTSVSHKINYENMYFPDEEIPVMGYTSGDESSSMELLEAREGEVDRPIHKLMPLPDVGSHLVLDALPSKTAEKEAKDGLRFEAEDSSEPEKPHLVDGRSAVRTDGSFSGSSSGWTLESSGSEGTSESEDNAESFFPSTKARLVGDRTCEESRSELVKLSCESESGKENLSDEVEPQPLTKNGGSGGKFVVDLEEPIHMTLEEVRSSLRTLNGYLKSAAQSASPAESACLRHRKMQKLHGRKMHFRLCLKPRTAGETAERSFREQERSEASEQACVPAWSLKHTLCNWFGIARCGHGGGFSTRGPSASVDAHLSQQVDGGGGTAIASRALPPVPLRAGESKEEHGHLELIVQSDNEQDQQCDGAPVKSFAPSKASADEVISDFASSIQKVKDCGWYWGPISGEMAEKILSNEPDGSFILRDSSDEYYIFSLTFKLNGFVRHVRIEHEHGNFSFGTFTTFKSHTIVQFIENAVEHSRSGRYLFFIHRRPVLGPMRVQLLHPVSRFKQVQSLQHTCRFTILKVVRRDLIDSLPIPKRLKDYLNTPHYYAEQMQEYQSVVAPRTPPASPSGENANPET